MWIQIASDSTFFQKQMLLTCSINLLEVISIFLSVIILYFTFMFWSLLLCCMSVSDKMFRDVVISWLGFVFIHWLLSVSQAMKDFFSPQNNTCRWDNYIHFVLIICLQCPYLTLHCMPVLALLVYCFILQIVYVCKHLK